MAKPRGISVYTIAIFAVLIMELGIFNLGFWRTASLPEVYAGAPTIGTGLRALGNDMYEVTDPAHATVTVPVSDSAGQPVAIGSIRVVAGNTVSNSTAVQTVSFAIHVPTDETTQLNTNNLSDSPIQVDSSASGDSQSWIDTRTSNGSWGDARAVLTYTSLPASQYLIIGKQAHDYHATEARITFLADTGTQVSFAALQPNAHIPFKISPVRLILELTLVAFLVLFRPRSQLYHRQIANTRLQWLAIGLFIVVWSCALAYIARKTQLIQFEALPGNLHWKDTEQYQRLGDALIHGRTWLDLPVDSALTTMDNPYSYFDRHDLAASGTHQFFWDHAYYNGHYYCYFGVVPAVLLFAPYQLITGAWLPTWVAIAVSCAVATLCGTLLVRKIARDIFPHISLGVMWLAIIGFNLATNLLQYCHRADTYGIPIAMSIALTLAGLLCWQYSKRTDSTVNPWLVGLGSICMALNLGTRPQFILASALAIPMFWQQPVHDRTLFSRRGFGATCAALVSYVVVFAMLMLYNYARFGSFLDFGATYNLSGYDITAYHGAWYLMPTQVFTELFQPVATTTSFPYLSIADTAVAAPNEPSIGGYFAMVPFSCLALLFWCVRDRLRASRVWGFVCTALAISVVTLFADISMGGTGMRYLGDYAYLLALCAVLVLFAIAKSPSDTDQGLQTAEYTSLAWRMLITITVTAVVLSAGIAFFGLFVPGRLGGWEQTVPQWYYAVKSWFIGLVS